MADDEAEEEEGPVVELGDGPAVEGAPLARITSRLHYGVERSEVVRRIGSEEIRTADGPRTLESVLEETDETYFPRRQDLEDAVRGVVGYGPVETTEREEADAIDDREEFRDLLEERVLRVHRVVRFVEQSTGFHRQQVRVAGTDLGAVTNAEGRYLLRGVPVGTQTIIASMIGYAAEEVENDGHALPIRLRRASRARLVTRP